MKGKKREREVVPASAMNAVDALILDTLGPSASLLGRKRKRPSRKSADLNERQQADEERVPHHRSLTQIAQELHCEGFGPFAAMGVLYYARHKIWGDEQADKIEGARKQFGVAMRDLDEETRRAVGFFIHKQGNAAFQAGLRIGLMTSVWVAMLSAKGADK